MTRFCIRCGEPHSDDSPVCGPCSYLECDEPVCIGCDQPFENGYCAACDEHEPLTECVGDPLLRKDAA